MDKDYFLKQLQNEDGFFKHNNYEVVEASEESCILKANVTENSLNPYKIVHGGFTFGLGDTVMGMLASKDGRPAVTLNSTINYLKAGMTSYIIAKGEILKQGKTTCYLQAKIYDDKENLIAVMDANYFYIDNKKEG